LAVKFISYVDQNEQGDWYIKLTDTLGEESVICNDLDEYEKQIQKMGEDYGNDIEVAWSKSDTLSPANYQDINEKMAIMQQKYQSEIDDINQNDDNSGFNPNE
jgi:hypothetical protein